MYGHDDRSSIHDSPKVKTPQCPSVDEWASKIQSTHRVDYYAASEREERGNSPAVQWLGLLASTAGGVGSIPGWGTKIWHAVPCDQNK